MIRVPATLTSSAMLSVRGLDQAPTPRLGGGGGGGGGGGRRSSRSGLNSTVNALEATQDAVPTFREEVASRIDNAAEGTIIEWPWGQEKAPHLHNPFLTEQEIKKQYGMRSQPFAPHPDDSDQEGPNNDELRRLRDLVEASRPKKVRTTDQLLQSNRAAKKALKLRIKEETNDTACTVLVMQWRDRVVDPRVQRREAVQRGGDELENDPLWQFQNAMSAVLEEERRVADQMLFAFQRKMREAKALQEVMDRNMTETFYTPANVTSTTMRDMPDWQQRSHRHPMASEAVPTAEDAIKLLPALPSPRQHASPPGKTAAHKATSHHQQNLPLLVQPPPPPAEPAKDGLPDHAAAHPEVVHWSERPLHHHHHHHHEDGAARAPRANRVSSIVAAMVGDSAVVAPNVFDDGGDDLREGAVANDEQQLPRTSETTTQVVPAENQQPTAEVPPPASDRLAAPLAEPAAAPGSDFPRIADESDVWNHTWSVMYTPPPTDGHHSSDSLIKVLHQRILRDLPKSAAPPADFMCPVLNEVMMEPVVLRVLADPTRCIRVEGVVANHAFSTSASLALDEDEEGAWSAYPKLLVHIIKIHRQDARSVSMQTDYQLMQRVVMWRIASMQKLCIEDFTNELTEAHCAALVEHLVFLASECSGAQRGTFPVKAEHLTAGGAKLFSEWTRTRDQMHKAFSTIEASGTTIDRLRSQLNIVLRDKLRLSMRTAKEVSAVTSSLSPAIPMTAMMMPDAELELQLQEQQLLAEQEVAFQESCEAESAMGIAKVKLMHLEELLDAINTQIYLYNRFTLRDKARWGPMYRSTIQAISSTICHLRTLGDAAAAKEHLSNETILSLAEYFGLTSSYELFVELWRIESKCHKRMKHLGMSTTDIIPIEKLRGCRFSKLPQFEDAVSFVPVQQFSIISITEETIFGGAHLGTAGYMAGLQMLRDGIARKKSIVVPAVDVYIPRPPSPSAAGGSLSPLVGAAGKKVSRHLRPLGANPTTPFWHFASNRDGGAQSPTASSAQQQSFSKKVKVDAESILSEALPRGTKFGTMHHPRQIDMSRLQQSEKRQEKQKLAAAAAAAAALREKNLEGESPKSDVS